MAGFLARVGARFTRAEPRRVLVRHAAATHANKMISRWFADLGDPNERLRVTLAELRAKSRQLVEDSGEAEGVLLDYQSDIVGAKGPVLQFRARSPRGIKRDALNTLVEREWKRWCRRGNVTTDGHDNWSSLCRLMIRSVVMDGEFVALHTTDPDSPWAYRLQLVDPDQIDETLNRVQDDGTRIVLGVELNRVGRPVAYHMWDRHPSLAGRRRRRVPATDVLHVFRRNRVGQVRGIPWFAPALMNWKLGDRYTEAELYQSLLAAAQGGFFEAVDGEVATVPTRFNPETGKEEPVKVTMEAEPGTARMLPPGWTFKAWEPKHPTANYAAFMRSIKRTIARAVGRSYASFTGDLSDVNFSSIRTDRLREIDFNKALQNEVLVTQFADVVFGRWATAAQMMGRIDLTGTASDDAMEFATFLTRGYPWIDPAKDAAERKMRLDNGLVSHQMLCAEAGLDYFDVIEQLAEEAEYADRHGVVLGEAAAAAVAPSDDADADAASDGSDAGNDDDSTEGARKRVRLMRGLA